MAPSATNPSPRVEGVEPAGVGANGYGSEDANNTTNDNLNGNVEDPTLYTTGYTHGYTTGYISGFTQSESPKQTPIAIVGMSCRLPGCVSTPDEFWELCSRSRTGWSHIPKERFDNNRFYHPNPGKGGCFNTIGGNFLKEDIGLFDAPFFGLTAQEATAMDPQARLLLECTFEVLDNAGIPKHEIVGKEIGVFIGGSFSEYEAQMFADSESIPMHQATGCAFSMQSNRISHFFDLRGPSFTMDTACSSTLVALHTACQSIRNGESKAALVGGCHLNMLPEMWISMSMSRLFGQEGRSFAFDNRGTGYGRGEGCGMVFLKPLDQALKDNDAIRAVIVGTGINQDGKTPGITTPNGNAQENLIRSVYRNAGIDPKDTAYVEAHGTGTKVGDPIEVAALHNVFCEDRSARKPLFIGSVKSNIGHLEAVSGIASLIKTAMMLERGFILPNYDFKKPHDKIPLSKWHFKVPVSQCPWPRPKRFASVNNFGFGGTNAHAVLERAPFTKKHDADIEDPLEFGSRKLFVLSANDKHAVEAMMKNMGIYLEQRPEIFQSDLMGNVAYTLGQRRSFFQWRVAIPAPSSFELIEMLNSGKISPAREIDAPRIGFIFTGQGAQWNSMGRELYEQYPVFAASMESCDECLSSFGATFSIMAELNRDAKKSAVNQAHISQPACTAVQIALTDLLRSWGVFPTAVAGHSSGEIAAAYAAGILPLDACMAISYHRGMAVVELKRKFPDLKGAMMAVGGSEGDIFPIIAELKTKDVRIACFNSPSSLTISGDEAAVDELQAKIEEKKIFNRKLQVDVAYHSHHMKLVAKEYHESLQLLDPPRTTTVKFHSSLLGKLADGSQLQPSYWVDNLTQAVRFSEALTDMCGPSGTHRTGVNMLVELGPHSALAGPVKQILKAAGGNAMKIPYASALVRNKDAVETALSLAGALFVKGTNLKFGAVNFPRPRKSPTLLVDIPRYPWNHQIRYWHASRLVQQQRNPSTPRNDIIGNLAHYSNDLEPIWRNIIRVDDLPWLQHHKIQGLTLFPMSGFVVMAVEAASQRALKSGLQFDKLLLRDVSVYAPLVITDQGVETTIQLRNHQECSSESSWDEFRIHSWEANKGWTEHCRGLIAVKETLPNAIDGIRLARDHEERLHSIISTIKHAETSPVDTTEMYKSLSDIGVCYGPSFYIDDCEASGSCSKAQMTVYDTSADMPHGFETTTIVHPAFLEQLIGMYWPILVAGLGSVNAVYLPSSIGRMTISRNISNITEQAGNTLNAFCVGTAPVLYPKPVEVSMFAISGVDSRRAMIELEDLTVSPIIERNVASEVESYRELCYRLVWEPVSQAVIASAQDTAFHDPDTLAPKILNGTTAGIIQRSNGNGGESIPQDFLVEKNELSVSGHNTVSLQIGLDIEHSDMTNGACGVHGNADYPAEEVAIIHVDTETQNLLVAKLTEILENSTGMKPSHGPLGSVDLSQKLCLFLAELDKPLLSKLTETEFLALQNSLMEVQGILWVVRGAYTDSQNPDVNMITGFSRSIRSETSLKFATLDLDPKAPLDFERITHVIVDVFKASFGPKAQADCELEYMEMQGSLFTPRIADDAEMNEYVHKRTRGSVIEPTPFFQEDRPLKMTIGIPGVLESLHFVDDDSTGFDLEHNEIEVLVKAIGMNRRDISAMINPDKAKGCGIECSGIVTRIGSSVNEFSPGYRVSGVFPRGVLSTYARTKASFVFRICDNVSFEGASSIPLAYTTAYYGLLELGQLDSNESVLIHGAASTTGQAAIVLAQMIGAEIFATVDSTEEKELLISSYKLADVRIFWSHSSFASVIRQATRGRGLDVILTALPTNTDTSREMWKALGSFGRVFSIVQDGAGVKLDTALRRNNTSFTSVELMSIIVEKPTTFERIISDISKLLECRKIRPIELINVFPIKDVQCAFKALQGDTIGKLVIAPQPTDMVHATPSTKTNTMFRADASYIIIGGSGGLGRSMTRWMVQKGARNILLVSRTGTVTGKVKELIDELAIMGANITVRQCNATDACSVDSLIKNHLAMLPPVRGLIHAAMVLDDVLFEKMTFHQYSSVIESKVQGAWNFHTSLKDETLDFFVAISSAAGAIGNRGQAAYAAANTFLDAFVQYRLGLGLPASSIALTAVSDAGYLADNVEAAAEVVKNLGSDSICEAEVLALLEAAISGRLAVTCNNYTITGMRITPKRPFWTFDAKFKHLRRAVEAADVEKPGSQATLISFNAALKASKTFEEAQEAVCNGLLSKLPSVLMLEAEDMDVTKSLANYALDSLIAIEVRNFITREFEANLQVLELLSSGSIETLAKTIVVKSKLVSF